MSVTINVVQVARPYTPPQPININDFTPVYGTGTYSEYVTVDSRSCMVTINVHNSIVFKIVDNLNTSVITITVYNTTKENATLIANLVKKEIEHFDEECVLNS